MSGTEKVRVLPALLAGVIASNPVTALAEICPEGEQLLIKNKGRKMTSTCKPISKLAESGTGLYDKKLKRLKARKKRKMSAKRWKKHQQTLKRLRRLNYFPDGRSFTHDEAMTLVNAWSDDELNRLIGEGNEEFTDKQKKILRNMFRYHALIKFHSKNLGVDFRIALHTAMTESNVTPGVKSRKIGKNRERDYGMVQLSPGTRRILERKSKIVSRYFYYDPIEPSTSEEQTLIIGIVKMYECKQMACNGKSYNECSAESLDRFYGCYNGSKKGSWQRLNFAGFTEHMNKIGAAFNWFESRLTRKLKQLEERKLLVERIKVESAEAKRKKLEVQKRIARKEKALRERLRIAQKAKAAAKRAKSKATEQFVKGEIERIGGEKKSKTAAESPEEVARKKAALAKKREAERKAAALLAKKKAAAEKAARENAAREKAAREKAELIAKKKAAAEKAAREKAAREEAARARAVAEKATRLAARRKAEREAKRLAQKKAAEKVAKKRTARSSGPLVEPPIVKKKPKQRETRYDRLRRIKSDMESLESRFALLSANADGSTELNSE